MNRQQSGGLVERVRGMLGPPYTARRRQADRGRRRMREAVVVKFFEPELVRLFKQADTETALRASSAAERTMRVVLGGKVDR